MSGPSASDDLPGGERWQSLLRGTTDAVFVLDRQLRIRFVNPAWEAVMRLRAGEARGLCCRGEPGAAARPAGAAALCPPPETFPGGQLSRVRRRVLDADGSWRLWEIDFLPLSRSSTVRVVVGRLRARPLEGAVAAQLPDRLLDLRDRAARPYTWDGLHGTSSAMAQAAAQARLAASVDAPVLIAGEPGTGKRWLARTIHFQGERRDGPFVLLDGVSLPPQVAAGLLEPTGFACRSAGTLYAREPARMPRDVQALLGELAERAEGGPRLVAGSATDLAAEVKAGRLREDVYRRVATLEIRLPPLRQRLAELPGLVEAFLGRIAEYDGRPAAALAEDALAVLAAHAWPGNLSELLGILRGARARATGDRIEARDLPVYLRRAAADPTLAGRTPKRRVDLDAVLAEVERRLIAAALREAKGNRSRAAQSLSIWRARLLRRMQALGIDNSGEDPDPPADEASPNGAE